MGHSEPDSVSISHPPVVGRLFILLATVLWSTSGLFQTGLPYLLYAHGVREITSQEAAGIGLLEPVMSPLWVYLCYGENTARWTMVGGALILAGLAARYIQVGSRQPPA